jgi:SNF family Na+-dependent transporter
MLVAVVAWLVLSYWPAAAAALPVIAFGPWLPTAGLVAAVLAVVVVIQGWIVYATVQSLVKPVDAAQAATLRQFNLSVNAEALLTVAPLLITLALAGLVLFAG